MWRERVGGHSYAAVAAIISAVVVLLFRYLGDDSWHWYVVPLWLCGTLAGPHAIEWLFSSRRDWCDPVGIVSAVALYNMLLAPMLHIALDYWPALIDQPQEWRTWLGVMALLNAAGMFLYTATILAAEARPARPWRQREIDPQWFWPVVLGAMAVSLVAQILVYINFGGVGGYIAAYEAGMESFEGMGKVFIVSESFPTLFILAFAVYARRHGVTGWWAIGGTLAAFLIIRFLFGGLRGSRSTVVWSIFLAVSTLHVYVRPFPRRAILLAGPVLVAFLYLMGFYKAGGLAGLEAFFQGQEERDDYARRKGRTLQVAVLSDLSRADVQAFILYRLLNYNDYDLAWGRTYAASLALAVPQTVWPDRPPTKSREGTQAMFGAGSYVPGRIVASQVYGLAGETMLNFGPVGVPVAFVPFAMLVGWCSRWRAKLSPGDARWLLYPFAIYFCVAALVGDSDSLFIVSILIFAIPCAVVFLGSRTVAAPPEPNATAPRVARAAGWGRGKRTWDALNKHPSPFGQ